MISIRILTVLSAALLISSGVIGAERAKDNDDKVTSTIKKADPPVVSNVVAPAETKDNSIVETKQAESDVQILWQVVSIGATKASFGSVTLSGTAGQIAVGAIVNSSNNLGQGYWYDFTPSCCIGIRGNVNSDPSEDIMVSDIAYLINYLFGIPIGPAPPCLKEGNANGDKNESINVSDVSYLVEYLFGSPSGPPPPACSI